MLARVVVGIFCLALANLTFGGKDGDVTASPATKDDPIAIIHKYVSSHQHWKPTEYKITEDHKERGFTVYLVFYLADKNMHYPGGGESFLAYYNTKTHTVAKEMHFQ